MRSLGSVGLVLLLLAPVARANDRLPVGVRPAYARGLEGAKRYARFILLRVFQPRLAADLARLRDPRMRRVRADDTVDEIVHLILPHGRKLVEDSLHGTHETHLGLLGDGKPAASLEAIRSAGRAGSGDMRRAIELGLRTYQRGFEDRLEQSLAEDLEDFIQKEVELRLALPVRGRPRTWSRPLPPKWEKRYGTVRGDVHEFTFYWLRRKQRFKLAHLALTTSRRGLDRARHTGEVWGITSGISNEAWSQNRLRIDFQWGRFGWQTLRRRIRRRMDQDQAQATWALARLVKELHAPETQRALRRTLEEKIQQRLKQPALRTKAESFPRTSAALRRALKGVRDELDPILNRAMDRVPLPPDLRERARTHGRRYMKEELESDLQWMLPRAAAPFAAVKRVRERLGDFVSEAIGRLDLGAETGRDRRSAAGAVRRRVADQVREELEAALQDAGLETDLLDPRRKATILRRVHQRFGIDRAIDREIRRQANHR